MAEYDLKDIFRFRLCVEAKSPKRWTRKPTSPFHASIYAPRLLSYQDLSFQAPTVNKCDAD